MPVEPFLEMFVQMYHLLSLLSALQFRIIKFISDNGASKSCRCKLIISHKENPMILASDLMDSLMACRDYLRPSYLDDLCEKACLPIVKDEKFKYAKTSVANLFYSLQDLRHELLIIFRSLTDVVELLQEHDPNLTLWDGFKEVIPDKLDTLIMTLSRIMVAWEVPLRPLPGIQMGHRFFLELGRSIFERRCQRLNDSMLKSHRKGYHSR